MTIKDKYKIQRKYITNKKARGGSKLVGGKPSFIVSHETANNNANADEHYTYFQNISFSASAHAFIDDTKILEIIPTDEKAWHVQYNQDKRTLGKGYANDRAVGPELCRTGNFDEAYDRYVWYHAYLCHKYGLKPKKDITAHKFEDPARRSDPHSWLEPNGVTWEQFLDDVEAYYNAWDGKETTTSKPESKPSKPKKRVVEDGYWGPKLTKELQIEFGTTADGVISGQYKNNTTINIHSVKFGSKGKFTGSNLIRAMQKWCGAKVDGYIGRETVTLMQKKLGTPADGAISQPSLMVKEMQKRLNKGTLI